MKIKVLVDNNCFIDEYYYGEPAVSYYIEEGGKSYLFDVGYSDLFIKNAAAMKLDLSQIKTLILSHGHNDHTGGLKALLALQDHLSILCHPDTFDYKEDDQGFAIGSFLSKDEVLSKANVHFTKNIYALSDSLYYLGEIPTLCAFEKRLAIGKCLKDGKLVEDYLYDDSALVYKSEKGLFIITGCSHSGICNIIEYAKEIFKETHIIGILGGFHLLKEDERLLKTIQFLKNKDIEHLYPAHCVCLKAKIEMGKVLEVNEVAVGLQIEIDEEGEDGTKYSQY